MSSNAERFGQIAKERREHLELNQLEVGDAGGPSNTKLTEIENGRLPDLTPLIAKKLDQGLRWEPGSARRTWLGGDPVPLEAIYSPGLEQAIAEVEAASISDSTKRFIIDQLKARVATSDTSEETA